MKQSSTTRCGRFRLATSRFLRRLSRLCTILLFALAAFLAASWFAIDWTPEGSDDYPGGTVVLDAAGNVLRVSLGEGDTDCRPSYEADPDDWIVKALVASEDSTFWRHCGVRPLSALRAAWQNLSGRRRVSGASTITMQAVRLIRPHPKTYPWKWRETIMALKMERARDKRWIISQYLNRAPFGSNLVGIEAAAMGWFGKGAKELGPGEAALLAGMVQSPTRFRPDRHLDRAIKRREYVLSRMLALGVIDDDMYEAAGSVVPEVCRAPRPFAAPHFCDWVLSRRGLGREAQRRSFVVRTALDPDIQAVCTGAVERAAAEGRWSAAAVVLRVSDGEPLALAVSGDYFDASGGQVNTATSPRPAGSTLKPLLAALAMDLGLVTPEERLDDSQRSYRGYRPANFDGRTHGPITLGDALVRSLNLPFVQLLSRTGTERFATALRSLGFSHLPENDSSLGLGMAIGNVEVTLVELAGAYATLARGGGDVFSREASYLVADMLSGGERSGASLGHVADVATARFAWKTGTSAAFRDAWTVAWNPEYVVAVWCGHMSGGFGDATLVGARAAAPVCLSIARTLYPGNEGPWFEEPAGIVSRDICTLTGLPAGPDCPEREIGRAIAGRSSQRLCDVHRRALDGGPAVPPGKKMQIIRPEDGAKFELVEGMGRQRVACAVTGAGDGERLWWFVDGVPAGESVVPAQFVLELGEVGEHDITCASASGATASVTILVESPAR